MSSSLPLLAAHDLCAASRICVCYSKIRLISLIPKQTNSERRHIHTTNVVVQNSVNWMDGFGPASGMVWKCCWCCVQTPTTGQLAQSRRCTESSHSLHNSGRKADIYVASRLASIIYVLKKKKHFLVFCGCVFYPNVFVWTSIRVEHQKRVSRTLDGCAKR